MSAWGDFLKARLAMIDEFDREGKTPEQIRFLLSMDLMQTVLLIMTARQHRAAGEEPARSPTGSEGCVCDRGGPLPCPRCMRGGSAK